MLDSLILNTVTRAAFPAVLVFSVYLLFAGHNAPGGGFVGGLVAGAGLVLRYAGRGLPGLKSVLPLAIRFELLLGLGLLAAAGTAIVPLLLGEDLLTMRHLEVDLPFLGHVALSTALFFDIGVYLIVVGLALGALEMLGRRPGPGRSEIGLQDGADVVRAGAGEDGREGPGGRGREEPGGRG